MAYERNLCVTMACVADRLAGPSAVVLLNETTLTFLMDRLDYRKCPSPKVSCSESTIRNSVAGRSFSDWWMRLLYRSRRLAVAIMEVLPAGSQVTVWLAAFEKPSRFRGFSSWDSGRDPFSRPDSRWG